MSKKASGFARMDGDRYMTPEWPVRALLSVYPMYGNVWEPACGEGAIARVIRDNNPFVNVVATDIDASFSESKQPIDFLTGIAVWFLPERAPFTIVTNPPYGKQGRLAEAFVRHAVEMSQFNGGRVAMLLPADWDSAKRRRDLFEDFPAFVAQVVLTEPIRWTNLPQSKAGPTVNHTWFLWDWARKGRERHWRGRVAPETRPTVDAAREEENF
jgi:predicted RNA methylase